MESKVSTTDVTLRLERTIAAPPEKVFQAWLDPEALKRWFAPGDDYQTVVHGVDAKVGGHYKIQMIRPGGGDTAFGKYLEIDRPKKLVFTWAWGEKSDAGETQVTILLSPEGNGTKLVLLHERLADAKSRTDHEHGWTGCLSRLAAQFPA